VSAWYRGDCHRHSSHSGWALTPARIVSDARAMGLDFLAATEHRDASGYEDWARQDLLVIPGREATTGTGHWLALGIPPGHVVDWRYGVRDGAINRYVAEVHRLGGLCVAAHPHAPYPSGQFMYPYAGKCPSRAGWCWSLATLHSPATLEQP
jgi:predicted metal-dependent phosphoesterase TrpH